MARAVPAACRPASRVLFVEPEEAPGGALAQPARARTAMASRALTRLFLHRRGVGLAGELCAGRINVAPRPRAPGPDMGRQLHLGRVVEGAGAQHRGLRRGLAAAEKRRAAVAAEEAVQGAAAVGL